MVSPVRVRVLLVMSLFLNLLCGIRFYQLRPASPTSRVGWVLPALEAQTAEGERYVLNYELANVPTVIYHLSPTCGWCERNAANLAALVAQTTGRYRFIGISLTSDGLDDYVKKHQFSFPIVTGLSQSAKDAYKFGGTPTTIVVDPSGKVIQEWAGAFADDTQREVEGYFGVKLPGLTVPAAVVPSATSATKGQPRLPGAD